MKTGLIVEGGGMRGIYSAGVLDGFQDLGLKFDYCIGVSSGAGNLVSFQSGQYRRNYRYYHDYSREKGFLSLDSWLRTGQYFGLDYIYGNLALSSGRDPVDYDALMANPSRLEFVATDAWTGGAHYFAKQEMARDRYDILKASCAIPAVTRPVLIGGRPYVDGGVADPIPYLHAQAQGCDFIVVILSASWPPVHKDPVRGKLLIRRSLRPYPHLLHKLQRTEELHELEHKLIFEEQRLGRALVIMPEHDEEMSTTTTEKNLLEKMYQEGYDNVQSMKDLLKEKLQR